MYLCGHGGLKEAIFGISSASMWEKMGSCYIVIGSIFYEEGVIDENSIKEIVDFGFDVTIDAGYFRERWPVKFELVQSVMVSDGKVTGFPVSGSNLIVLRLNDIDSFRFFYYRYLATSDGTNAIFSCDTSVAELLEFYEGELSDFYVKQWDIMAKMPFVRDRKESRKAYPKALKLLEEFESSVVSRWRFCIFTGLPDPDDSGVMVLFR